MKMNNTGFILWLMGPTSSGKTTLAEALVPKLRAKGENIIHLDGDEVRDLFGKDLGFGPEQRNKVVNALIYFAKKATEAGTSVVVSALTANQSARKKVQSECSNLLIGYIKCSIDACIERDPKGLYQKARKGEINTLIGYNSEYHPPTNPDFTINTEQLSISEAVESIIEHLEKSTESNEK